MIGKLKGVIDSYGEDFIVLDVHGVGYLVHCSARTLQALPAAGEATTLSIETHVREDQIRLFGFLSDVEREWFRLLQTVQGVGAKVALSVLSTFRTGDLASAIAMGDKAAIRQTPGVGPKVAERLVIELKDKAPAYSDICPARCRKSARRGRCSMRSRRLSISATASRRPPPPFPPPAGPPAKARRLRN
jgi:Holliday junction DNA helicase RuvA